MYLTLGWLAFSGFLQRLSAGAEIPMQNRVEVWISCCRIFLLPGNAVQPVGNLMSYDFMGAFSGNEIHTNHMLDFCVGRVLNGVSRTV